MKQFNECNSVGTRFSNSAQATLTKARRRRSDILPVRLINALEIMDKCPA